MKHKLFWILLLALIILHHDWWLWNDDYPIFGFLPIGLGYHMLISLAAVALWAWAVFGAWPEIFMDEPEDSPS